MPDKAYCSAVHLEKNNTFVFKLFKNFSFLSSYLSVICCTFPNIFAVFFAVSVHTNATSI